MRTVKFITAVLILGAGSISLWVSISALCEDEIGQSVFSFALALVLGALGTALWEDAKHTFYVGSEVEKWRR